MDLSAEDALRLNVMLANELHAVRIDESSMTVYGLSPQGETAIRLNPNCRDDPYLKQVRELLSGQILGSPGGYPVYLKRWTRMGQARDDNLEKLLLLGEPEAVVAVVHAQGLSHEIARRAWWVMPTSENARKMLARDCVRNGELGRELAAFLVEFLPFEENQQAIIESVRLILQPGLIDADVRDKLWAKGRHKNTYFVGFLQATPDDLPESRPPHPDYDKISTALGGLAGAGNPVASTLIRLASEQGQAYLATFAMVMKKPNNQDVVVELFEAVKHYTRDVAHPGERLQDIEHILIQAERRLEGLENDPHAEHIQAVLDTAPDLQAQVQALLVLSGIGERLLAPVFARSDAIGSVMRRQIEHITSPVTEHLKILHAGTR